MTTARFSTRRGNDESLFPSITPMLPSLVAISVGAVLALSADGLVLRLLGGVAAGIPFLLASVETIKRTLFTLIVFLTPLALDLRVAELPKPDEFRSLINGFDVSVTTFCIVALIVVMLAEYVSGRFGDLSPYRAAIPALAYLGSILLSLTVAADVSFSVFEVVTVLETVALLIIAIYFIRDKATLVYTLVLMAAGLAVQSALVLGQATVGLSFRIGPLSLSRLGGRMGGTLGHPNVLAEYLSLMMLPALGLAVARLHSRYRLVGTVAFVMALPALLFTASRGAWVGFAIALAVFGLIGVRKGWVPKTVVFALIGFIALGGLAAFAMRGLSDSADTADARLVLMTLALRMIGTHPIFGVGANNFIIALEPFLTVEFANSWISTVHNKYLLVLAETGIFGLATWLWLLIAGLRNGYRVAMRGDPMISPLALGLACGVLANMVHMGVNVFHDRTHGLVLWLVLGTLAAAWNIAGRESRQLPATIG